MHLPLRDVGVADFEVRPPPARAEALVSLSLPLLLAACVLPVLSNATHAHKVAARHAMAISGVCGRRLSPGAARNHRSPYSFTNYSVSGFSAGGSMALFHLVSHSASVTGVGLVGGSPYASTLHITPSSPLSKWDKLFDYFFFCVFSHCTHARPRWLGAPTSVVPNPGCKDCTPLYLYINYLFMVDFSRGATTAATRAPGGRAAANTASARLRCMRATGHPCAPERCLVGFTSPPHSRSHTICVAV